jgi:hypothetical protein
LTVTKASYQTDALSQAIPLASIARHASSSEQRLSFCSPEDLDRAWELGIFYLKVPEHLDVEDARRFGSELIAADCPYRQVPQYGELEGFIALENNQQTKLALRRERWDQHYPAHVAAFGRELDELGVAIMREVLRQSRIPEPLWDRASGGYASGGGDAFLNFVHYDTRTPDLGLRPHTDYGFVTILGASAPGLQIEIDGKFEDVPVQPGYLIINFGEALNFITAHSDRAVTAVRHRVLSQRATNPVRHGIVYFANPDLDGMLWQFDAEGVERGTSSVDDLFAQLEKKLTQYS